MPAQKIGQRNLVQQHTKSYSGGNSYVAQYPDRYENPVYPRIIGGAPKVIDTSKGWQDLGRALSGVSRQLGQMAVEDRKQYIQDERVAGEAAFTKGEGKKWSDYLSTNPDMSGASPFYQEGYQKAWLQSSSIDFQAEMQEWAATDQRFLNAGNVEEADAIAQEWSNKWVAENLGRAKYRDEDYVNVFAPMVMDAHRSVLSTFNSNKINRSTQEGLEETGRFIGKFADQIVGTRDWADPAARAQLLPQFGAAIQQETDAMIAISPAMAAKFYKQVADAVGFIAEEYEDADVLDVLDHVQTRTGSLGDTLEVRKMRSDIEDRIEAKAEAKRKEARTAALTANTAAKKNAKQDAMYNIASIWWEHGGVIDEATDKQIKQIALDGGMSIDALNNHLADLHGVDSKMHPKEMSRRQSDALNSMLVQIDSGESEGFPPEAYSVLVDQLNLPGTAARTLIEATQKKREEMRTAEGSMKEVAFKDAATEYDTVMQIPRDAAKAAIGEFGKNDPATLSQLADLERRNLAGKRNIQILADSRIKEMKEGGKTLERQDYQDIYREATNTVIQQNSDLIQTNQQMAMDLRQRSQQEVTTKRQFASLDEYKKDELLFKSGGKGSRIEAIAKASDMDPQEVLARQQALFAADELRHRKAMQDAEKAEERLRLFVPESSVSAPQLLQW